MGRVARLDSLRHSGASPRGVSEAPDLEDLSDVLADDCARCILVRAYSNAMSATELAEHCDVSEPTVYRRLDRLAEHDLVAERTQPDERGHHYKEYRTKLDRVSLDLTPDGFEVDLTRREPMADRFTRLVEDL